MTLSRNEIYNMAALDIAKMIRMKSNSGELSNVGNVNVKGDTVHIVLGGRFETKEEVNKFENKISRYIEEWPFVVDDWIQNANFMRRNDEALAVSSLNPAFGGCDKQEREKHDDFIFYNEDGYKGIPS